MAKQWVQDWGMSQSALSYFMYPDCKKTYRLVIKAQISCEAMRIGLSNSYGKDKVKIGGVTVALCDENGTLTSEPIAVTYGGFEKFTLKKGQKLVSNDVDIAVEPGQYYCVNMYVEKGDLTCGNMMNNCVLITAKGNNLTKVNVPNETRPRDTVIKIAEKLLGFDIPKPIPLFDSVEFLNADGATSIVIFGDSVSQQGHWTNPFTELIREAYPGRYSVINKSVMGCRVLRDCSPLFIIPGLYGKRGTDRIITDVYAFSGQEYCILFLGVNDIFEFASINAFPWEKPDLKQLQSETMRMVKDLQARGIKVICFNIPAFNSAPDSTPEKDQMRRDMNVWYDDNKTEFDGFFDICSAAIDPDDDSRCRPEFIGGDGLHPNAYGGDYLCRLVDLDMFKPE